VDYRLAPVRAALAAAFGAGKPDNLAPGLLVNAPHGWISASSLVDGSRLPDLLGAFGRRWQAEPHVAAAQAWKSYAYSLALPVVVGWACARRVPLVRPSDVMVRVQDQPPPLMIGLCPSVRVAILPSDGLARAGRQDVVVMADEAALLAALRASTLDAHLFPLLTRLRSAVRIGVRPLLGSLASGVAYCVLRSADALPGSAEQVAGTLLATLGVQDLVDLVPEPSGGFTVQRKTCCLAFTLPRPRICPGCCIQLDRTGAGGARGRAA
jgi:hypothetical protein